MDRGTILEPISTRNPSEFPHGHLKPQIRPISRPALNPLRKFEFEPKNRLPILPPRSLLPRSVSLLSIEFTQKDISSPALDTPPLRQSIDRSYLHRQRTRAGSLKDFLLLFFSIESDKGYISTRIARHFIHILAQE